MKTSAEWQFRKFENWLNYPVIRIRRVVVTYKEALTVQGGYAVKINGTACVRQFKVLVNLAIIRF